MAAYMEALLRGQSHAEIVGPIADAGGPNGPVLQGGEVVEEWGDTERVDMCFSVAKSVLSAVAGLAYDSGPIADLVRPGLGSRPGRPARDWACNDVRVNLLRRWRPPLPDVLREHLMDPIGASATWVWHGYRNSYVTIDGRRMQSVSGGGHWGGGLWASTRDLARFGQLYLQRGLGILSEDWIDRSLTPCEHNPEYGELGGGTFSARGGGGSRIHIDPSRDLVVVTRWVDDPDAVVDPRAPNV